MKTKKTLTIVLMLTQAVLYGCQSSSSPRGGGMTKDVGFKIVVPNFTREIKQSETQNITVSLERGDYFKQDVQLQIQASKGIDVEPTSVLIKSSDRPEAQLRIAVPKDASIGEYIVYVKGIPETGEPTSTVFTVKVVSP
jgi:uncharacterized membrane protein